MKRTLSILVLVAAPASGLLPVGCGPAAAPTAEKPQYPPGGDPVNDYLPGTPKKPAQ